MLNEAELKEEYEKRIPMLQALGNWVKNRIDSELEKELGNNGALQAFLKVPAIPRVKSVDSFLEKSLRRKQKENPLTETTDQVGLRYVVLLQKDVTMIGQIIQRQECWSCRQDRDFEQERLNNPDYFSYQSDHYIVFNNEALNIDGIQVPQNTPCEIQVRTLLQHAYAEMSHDTVYKPSISVPDADNKQARRALAKGSALIETTDGVFDEIDRYLEEYSQTINALLAKAAELYITLTGVIPNSQTNLGMLIADEYKELLSAIKLEDMARICNEPLYASVLKKKRESSVIYRDCVIILLFCLIDQNPTAVPKLWPFEQEYLRDLYSNIGMNPQAYGID